jgi:nucleotide-binding universal stress UspA family protein
MKVLVAVDDSKFSDAAVRAIVSQFRPDNTEVRVLHVVQPFAFSTPPQMSRDYAPELELQRKQGKELVQRAAQTLTTAGFKTSTDVVQGDVRLKVIDCALEWNADLIVTGSHGRTPIQRLLLGSAAEFIARNAQCSVEIVRTPSTK